MRAALVVAALSLAACAPDFVDRTSVERVRILGMQAAPLDEPDRATILPGDVVILTPHVAYPRAPLPLGWALVGCVAGLPGSVGVGECVVDPEVVFEAPPSLDAPEIVVPLPEDLPGGLELRVFGSFCVEAAARRERLLEDRLPGTDLCADPSADGESFSLTVEVAEEPEEEGAINRHPALSQVQWQLDGFPWAAEGDACAGGPTVTVDDEPELTFAIVDPAALTDVDGEVEVWGVSHYVTYGELEREISVLEGAADPPTPIDWKIPKDAEVAPEGREVRFHVVVRDQRGGVAFESRAVCLGPG